MTEHRPEEPGASGAGTIRPPELAVDEALAATWLGRQIPAEARAALSQMARPETYPTGTTVLREGEPCRALGIVVRGRLALRLLVPHLGPLTILTVEPGDIFGWSAVVPPHRSTSTVVAVTDTVALAFEAELLRRRLADDPALAAAFYRVLLAAVARRLTATRLQLTELVTAIEANGG
jgi:CRP/FNR family cyclic AMP-dependent transcriptional regulator